MKKQQARLESAEETTTISPHAVDYKQQEFRAFLNLIFNPTVFNQIATAAEVIYSCHSPKSNAAVMPSSSSTYKVLQSPFRIGVSTMST